MGTGQEQKHQESPDMEAQQFSPTPQTDFAVLEDNTLLIVDDDRAFLARLARAASRSRPRPRWRMD